MTLHPLQLDPEVEEILREVAADPRSKLLRVQRPTSVRALTEQVPTVGVATAGLTVAERHLVQTYRAEVAYALRLAAWYRLAQSDHFKAGFSRQARGPSNLHAVPTRGEVESVARSAPVQCDPATRTAQLLIDSCARVGSGEWPSVTVLLEAAQRLCPSLEAAVNAGIQLFDVDAQAARLVFIELTQRPLSRWDTTVIQSNLAFSYFIAGDVQASHRMYEQAALGQPQNLNAVASLLVTSSRLGDARLMDWTSKLLDHGWSSSDPVLCETIALCAMRSRLTPWRLDVSTTQRLQRLSVEPSTNTGRLVNAVS